MKEQLFSITREIGIDAGHRVTYHGSKCRNIHGHRYTVLATAKGALATSGEEEGMVQDFGFLKNLMMAEIDAPCDHGLILWSKDPLLATLPGLAVALEDIEPHLDSLSWLDTQWDGGKLYIVDTVPTAENLARHWFERIAPRIVEETNGRAYLSAITVYETPNCSAEYPIRA